MGNSKYGTKIRHIKAIHFIWNDKVNQNNNYIVAQWDYITKYLLDPLNTLV